MRLVASLSVVVFSVFAFVACGGGSTKSDATATSVVPSASSGSAVASLAANSATAVAVRSSAAPAGPATFSVIAGHAEGAIDIEMYMPAEIRVREGDSIEWTASGFEGHTITFGSEAEVNRRLQDYLLPDPDDPTQKIFNPEIALHSQTGNTYAGDGTYTNSGFIGVPVAATYKLTFTKSGTYQYLCLVHPFTMRGTVSVQPPADPVDSPEAVAARGQSDLTRYVAVEKRAIDEATAEQRDFPAVGGASIHRIAVGLTTPYGQVATYVKPVLDIKTGDTVIFANDDRDFHNVTFKGAGELPPGIGIRIDPAGRGMNYVLSKDSAVGVDPPTSGFDANTFISSGSMGVLQPRLTWTVRFDKPGQYVYNCTIHVLAGMAGIINVQ